MSLTPTLRKTVLLLVTSLVPAAAWSQGSGSTIPTGRIFEAIGVVEHATVCEIGAGNGQLSIAAARLVGPAGRVYTSELGEERIGALRAAIDQSALRQITVVEGAPAGTNFPDGACDALFMRNVYHHFGDPAAMNAAIARALKPGAHLAVVDFAPPGREAGRPADRDRDGMHGVTPDSVARELSEAGFQPVSTEIGSQRWFMVVVAKPSTTPGRAAGPAPLVARL